MPGMTDKDRIGALRALDRVGSLVSVGGRPTWHRVSEAIFEGRDAEAYKAFEGLFADVVTVGAALGITIKREG